MASKGFEEGYLAGLEAAHKSVDANQKRFFKSSRDRKEYSFGLMTFGLGLVKSYLTVYILGRWPQHFWKWHALQFGIIFPIQWVRWGRQRYRAYFMELCWMVSLSMTLYFGASFFFPGSIPDTVRDNALATMFALGNGPLGFAVVFLHNSLVPHSFDHMSSLLIHLQPTFSTFALRWLVPSDLFPNAQMTFTEYIRLPVMAIGAWSVFHALMMLSYGLNNFPAQGQRNSYFDNVSEKGSERPGLYDAITGRRGDGGNEVVRYLKYNVMQFCLYSTCASTTWFLYSRPETIGPRLHFGFICTLCLASAYRGGAWYSYSIQRFSKDVEKLIKEKKA